MNKDRTWIIYFAVATVVIVAAVGIPRWTAKAKLERAARRIVQEQTANHHSAPTEIFPLQPFLFTVKENGKQYRVNITMSIGFDPTVTGLSNEILQRRADIWFELSDLLGALKKDQLDEESDKMLLKELVKSTVNEIITNGQIREVYFREFIIAPY